MPYRTITPTQFRDMVDSDAPFTVVDTRDEESFESWRIADSIRYRHTGEKPLDVERFERETGLGRSDPIVTMCAKGKASSHLAAELAAAGYESVAVVEAGMEGWSEVYDRVTIPTSTDDVSILQVKRRAKGCLGYVVGDLATGEAAAIDPTRHIEEFQAAAAEIDCDLTHVFDTHVHADHVSGGRRLADAESIPYHLGAGAVDRGVSYDF
ncbi:MAG: rhodanese-like domain-containing protein, partial [Halobacteriales archaeon]|nr:rhodanese-like domain-containing protein [Halobacteriales archaeon]